MTDVAKVFANVLASKEEQYVKHTTPFMTAVAHRIQKSFAEYVGKTLTAEKREELVKKCEGILREVLLGQKPEVTVSKDGFDFTIEKTIVQAKSRVLDAKWDYEPYHESGAEAPIYIINTPKTDKPVKPMKAPIRTIPASIHATWHSIVENGQGDD